MKKLNNLIAMACLCVAISEPTFALGKVSRACNFSTLPAALKVPAVALFSYLGMPPYYDALPLASNDIQRNYFILESISTDYGEDRYYLFAENRIYKMVYSYSVGPTRVDHSGYRSPWASESLDPRIFNDSRMTPFHFNRNVLYSVRAGHPDIVQYFPDTSTGLWLHEFSFKVEGRHYYFDAITKARGTIQDGVTQSTSCSLTQWGLEDRG